MTWQTRGSEKQSYTFKYDCINRMTEADDADISNAGAITNDRYTEKLTYDIRQYYDVATLRLQQSKLCLGTN